MTERRDLTPAGIERRQSFDRRRQRAKRWRHFRDVTAEFVLTALLAVAAAALALVWGNPPPEPFRRVCVAVDYAGGTWVDNAGRVVGYASEEDEPIRPTSDC